MHDDAFYVPKELFEEWARRDPIERFRTWLRDNAELTDDEEDEITAGVKRLLNEAIQRAEESPLPDPATVDRRRLRRRPTSSRRRTTDEARLMAEKTYLQAISDVAPAGDAARPARLRARRGRRRLRRRVQGDAGLPGGVRARAACSTCRSRRRRSSPAPPAPR